MVSTQMYHVEVDMLILFAVIFGFVRSRELTNITLVEREANWNSANSYCKSLGGQLLVIDNSDKVEAMKTFLLPGAIWEGKLTGPYWTGLHRVGNTPFKWYEGCLPLDQGIDLWDSGQPNPYNGKCSTVTSTFKAESFGCPNSAKFICQKTAGPCIFEETEDATITGVVPTSFPLSSSEQCELRCRETQLFDQECWAFTISTTGCNLYLAPSAFYFEDKSLTSVGSTLYRKMCYVGSVIQTQDVPQIYDSDPVSPCNSSSTAITSVERYGLQPSARQQASIIFHQDLRSQSDAEQICNAGGGHLIYIDYQIQQLLMKEIKTQWAPNTNIWIGIDGIGSWFSGETITYTNGVSGSSMTIDKDTGTWSAAATSDNYQFICQIRSGDCDFEEISDKAISSSVVDKNVTLSTCKTRCNSYSYNGDDCWAITYSSTDSSCYYQFTSDPGIADNTSVVIDGSVYSMDLYRRVCYTFSTAQTPSRATTATADETTTETTSSSTLVPLTTTEESTTETVSTGTSSIPLTTTEESTTETTFPDTSSVTTTTTEESVTDAMSQGASSGTTTTEESTTAATSQSTSLGTTTTEESTTEMVFPETSSGPSTITEESTTETISLNTSSTTTITGKSTRDVVPPGNSSGSSATTEGSTTEATSPGTSSGTTITETTPSDTPLTELTTTQGNTPDTTINTTENGSRLNTTSGDTCVCYCRTDVLQLGSSELSEKLLEITSKLYVNPKEVSAAKRKLISAVDARPSARVIGSVLGIATLSGVFGFLVLLDMQNILGWYMQFRQRRS